MYIDNVNYIIFKKIYVEHLIKIILKKKHTMILKIFIV